MTGSELYKIRCASGLSVEGFGRAIGWTGSYDTIKRKITRLEMLRGRPIPRPTADRVREAQRSGFWRATT